MGGTQSAQGNPNSSLSDTELTQAIGLCNCGKYMRPKSRSRFFIRSGDSGRVALL